MASLSAPTTLFCVARPISSSVLRPRVFLDT